MKLFDSIDPTRLAHLVTTAKRLNKRYRQLTGRPLGITGEVAEYEAAKKLNLRLAKVRQAGFDAVRMRNGRGERIQIKGRCIIGKKAGEKLAPIDRTKKWNSVVYVELDGDLEPVSMREAARTKVLAKLDATNSKARKRGVLSVSMFRSISKIVWERPTNRPAR